MQPTTKSNLVSNVRYQQQLSHAGSILDDVFDKFGRLIVSGFAKRAFGLFPDSDWHCGRDGYSKQLHCLGCGPDTEQARELSMLTFFLL